MTIISLIGIDGSGKSNHSFLLLKKLIAKGEKGKYAHIRMGVFRFFSLPLLKLWKLAGLPTESNHPSFKRHTKLSSFWAWCFFIDYQLFYSALCFPQYPKNESDFVFVFDRYIYDALVDLSIARGNSFSMKNTSTRTFLKILPKPSITLLLDVEPETAIIRKGDTEIHDLDYLTRRRIIYLELAKQFGFHIVNANKSFNEVHSDILEILKIEGLKIFE
ncbi:MAG TPA: hypothetical protein QGF52_00020 [Nitrososphaerales archaeon]|nr:hypothetical protein [Nitrososphaerales archaeon]